MPAARKARFICKILMPSNVDELLGTLDVAFNAAETPAANAIKV